MTLNRLERVWPLLDELKVEVALVASPATRCYLTGFSGDLTAGSTRDVALCTGSTMTLLTHPIQAGWAGDEVVSGVAIVTGIDWLVSASETIKSVGWRAVAIDDVALSHASVLRLRELLPAEVVLTPIGTRLSALRSRKEPGEIDVMRRASALTDAVFLDAATWIEAGMTERQVARRIKETFYRLGADDLAFDVIVASGPNSAKPHHRPSDRLLVDGDAVVLDLGCRLDRYCSDLTRTLPVGQATDRFATLYNATLEARDAAVRLVEPGRPAREVAEAANDLMRRLGHGDLLMHGLGHGVGLQVHESPAISETSEDILRVGNVFSIEPGLYDPAWGGIRTEDVVVVTEGGRETITTAPTLDLDRGRAPQGGL